MAGRMIDHNDDELAKISRRSFFKLPAVAAVGSTLLMFCPSILNPEKAYAAASQVSYLNFNSLPAMSAQWVASTITPPKSLTASGSYTKDGNIYIIMPGWTASFRLNECGVDASGDKFDVEVTIGKVYELSPMNPWNTINGRGWLKFYLRYPADFEGQFGWEIDSNCAEAWVKIRYYKTGTNTGANVKIFGCFSDIDQSQGSRNDYGINGIAGGDEGVSFGVSQSVKVFTKSGHWLNLHDATGGVYFTNPNIDGTDGDFDDRTTAWVMKDANWLDVYYTGGNCGIDFSFKLPGGVVKYWSDGRACYSEVWSAGTWHTVPQAATSAGDKANCSGQFQAWYTDPSYRTRYTGSTLREGTINLYGRNFAVIHYRVDGSSSDVYTETIQVGAWHVASANATNAARKSGCTPGFKGWYTDAACTQKYNGRSVTGDVYLYAKNILTVHYRVDGSSSDVYTEQIAYGTRYTAKAAATNVAKKPNCTPGFTGWCTDSTCNSKYNGSTLTRDLYLYAKNLLTVKFQYSSRSEHRSGVTYYDRPGDSARAISIALPGNKVVMAGSTVALTSPRTAMFASLPDNHWVTYRFNAWSTNSAMSGALINQITPIRDTIVYAKWVESPVDGVEDAREI